MRLILIRHGSPYQKEDGYCDIDRPLKPGGEEEINELKKYLLKMNIEFEYIITTKYSRAKQTAAILSLGNLDFINESSLFEPSSSPKEAKKYIFNIVDDYTCICVVSHQPFIMLFLKELLRKSPNLLDIPPATCIILEIMKNKKNRFDVSISGYFSPVLYLHLS